ncbi:hypothetical protein [Pseudomonas phage vB_Pae_CF3a]|nr:hypothetical protein [Pseudomonas phage vB_Pae_CF3a]QBI77512.1 hypothetical protein [Pseudomonas phage vB_Pae_CF60a]QBI77623.1 hypothetical protein [Pseudomonas phage vB_Pae_CF79a]QBI78086.1 hypothetical protein [Pseudomonas phage vB_Pae_CF208a]
MLSGAKASRGLAGFGLAWQRTAWLGVAGAGNPAYSRFD